MKLKGSLDNGSDELGNRGFELAKVLVKESSVNGVKGRLFREGNGHGPEPALETGVHVEGTSSRVHRANMERVLDILQG